VFRFLSILLLAAFLPASAAGQGEPVLISFLNVGQGDAILIQAPEGQTALIDAGPGVPLVPMLQAHGVEALDLVVASHPHADHIGGMGQVLQSIPVRYYMDNGVPHTTATYSAVMQELRKHPGITYLEASPRTLGLGSVSLRILPLPPRPTSNHNNHSVGLVLKHGSFLGFFSGDSERWELARFLQDGAVPDVSLLKAPHHGSDDGFTEAFLQAASPEVVVICVGPNSFGHPRAQALRAYERYADQVLRTDRDGTVTIAGYEDGSYEVVPGIWNKSKDAATPSNGKGG